jgi:hypothetical protein
MKGVRDWLDFNQRGDVPSNFSKSRRCQISWKSIQWLSSCCAYGQTERSVAYLFSNSVCTSVFARGKVAEAWKWPLTFTSAEGKKTWSGSSIPWQCHHGVVIKYTQSHFTCLPFILLVGRCYWPYETGRWCELVTVVQIMIKSGSYFPSIEIINRKNIYCERSLA